MTKTKKNPYKEQRDWNELLHEKKAYILRKQQEDDAKETLREALNPKLIPDPYSGRWEED